MKNDSCENLEYVGIPASLSNKEVTVHAYLKFPLCKLLQAEYFCVALFSLTRTINVKFILIIPRKYSLGGYILGVLTYTTAWDQLWGGDIF